MFKKLLLWLQLRDGIWSIPLAFIGFWLVGSGLGAFFGYGTGSYDPGLFQAFFFAVLIVVGATNAAIIGIWFNFRAIHRYMYGRKDKEGNFFNPSKADLKNIRPIHKLVLSLVILFFFIITIIAVFIVLV